MNVLQPIAVSRTMIGAGCTLSEDPTPLWVSGTNYNKDDEVHLLTTARVYKCAKAGSSTISPELDPTTWVDMRPTNKMAPFDTYTNTTATSTTVNITYPITARFVNAIALYGIQGSGYVITVKDAVGGTVIWTRSGTLKRHGRGWYAYLFGTKTQITRLVFFNLPIRPAAEISITITAGTGLTRAIGLIVMGKLRPLTGGFEGGTENGATAEPVSYSYIKTETDGTTNIIRRHSGTDLKCRVFVSAYQADNALSILQDVLDIPVAWIASDAEGVTGLSTFGLASNTPVQYEANHAYIDINVRGLV